MTSTESSVAEPPPQPPPRTMLRGSPKRITDFQEAFQESYLRAIAAAAGCVIAGKPEIDEGIDVLLSHTSSAHSIEKVLLEVQLKATSTFVGSDIDHLSVDVRRDRYDYYRTANPSVHKIIVIMSLPASQDDWVSFKHKRLALRHAAYWVNLAGAPANSAARPSVSAPKLNRFDDEALCGIMERIGQGSAP